MEDQLHLGDSEELIALKIAWQQALGLLAPEISLPSFEGWVKTAQPVAIEDGVVAFNAVSELAKIFLLKYSDQIKTALSASLKKDIEVSFRVLAADQPEQVDKPQEKRPARGTMMPLSLPLNDKYIFSSFVTGPCNRLAQAGALSVAEKPGKAFNPFFLYGGPGLGKTHLLQAIGHRVLEAHPRMKVAYVSAEMFTSQYVSAIREHRSEEFRNKYRNIDVWLLDDVQFIAGKERTKEEFFHTFNALYQMNKQIVLSSDRPPRDLAPLEERLRSRFESGLVADIVAPDLETRIAILESKAIGEDVTISSSILECIAALIPNNVRALEGALVTLIAYSSLMKAPLTIQLAEEVLGRYLSERKYTELSPDAVKRAVAQAFGLEVEDLQSQRRTQELVAARHVAMYLARELTNHSLQAIGAAFGGRNHTSVLHAHARIRELLENDPSVKQKVNDLMEDLRAGRT